MTWIADGDTIDVDVDGETLTVRLVATNAPDQGECYADQGLDHLIDTLKGATVELEVVGIDQFGRTLAHVFEGTRHLNLEMVGLGLSLASTPDEDDPYRRAVLDAEESAFADGVGLWGPGACGDSNPIPDVAIDVGNSITDPPGADDEDLAAERLVIANEGTSDIDMSGWIVRDESSRHRYEFPSGFLLSPGEEFAVSSNDPNWDPGGGSVWNNGGDMALLQLPDGTVVDRWRY